MNYANFLHQSCVSYEPHGDDSNRPSLASVFLLQTNRSCSLKTIRTSRPCIELEQTIKSPEGLIIARTDRNHLSQTFCTYIIKFMRQQIEVFEINGTLLLTDR